MRRITTVSSSARSGADGAAVFVAAVTFGAAHIHHRFDAGVSWIAVAVQFTYTSLFGAYSAYLFLRTGLVIGPLLAHAFCNSMGLPDFGGITSHRHSHLVAAAYIAGLAGFIALVTVRSPFRAFLLSPHPRRCVFVSVACCCCQVDAIYHPALFGSPFWREGTA